MNTIYEALEKIYKKNNLAYFSMAVCHLLDRGFDTVLQITDEDIENMKYENQSSGNRIDLMNENFIKWIWRTAKDIAIACDKQPSNLIMFCQAVDLFDVHHFTGGLNKNRMEEMLNTRIANENCSFYNREDVETLCDLYNCELEEFEALGCEIPEDMFEEV